MAVPIQQAAAGRRRRPRDRKQQIVAAAARQFWDLGYPQVSMADIAAAVGIGASALYRHFRGKQDLLVAVLDEALVELEAVVAGARDVDAAVAELARVALARREFGVLWDRDAGQLPEAAHRALRDRVGSLIRRAADLVATDRSMEPAVARLRTHAVFAVLGSPSRHRADLDPAAFEAILVRAATAVLDAELPPPSGAVAAGDSAVPRRLPASRREAILAAAIRLFDQRGYPSVSLTDIGTAIGIAGPSVYNHFASKTDILVAALTRGNEALWLAFHHALARAEDAHDGLDRVLASYAAFAVENPAIVSVLLSEVTNLPAEQRARFRRPQQAYVHEWVTLLRSSHADLGEPEARTLVHAALATVTDLVRVRAFQRRPDLTAELTALGRGVLTAGAALDVTPR